MVQLTEKNKIFIYRLTLLVIIILKFKIISRIGSNKTVNREVQNLSFPMSHKLNCSIDSFVKNSSKTNVMIIYGASQSGKSYLIDQIKEELFNMSYIPFSVQNICQNDTNFSVPNGSVEIFIDNHTYESENLTIKQQIDELTSAFQECNLQNITQLLTNLSSNSRLYITIHDYGKNRSINVNLTQKMIEFENISFIIESSNYSSIDYNNSNITIIHTEPINNTALFLSKQNAILTPQEAEIVEKSFGGHVGSIVHVVNDFKKGEKINNIIPKIENEIYGNISLIIDDFNSTDDILDICNSSVKISDLNSTNSTTLISLLENGFLYVNDSYVINFANPVVKKFICQKYENLTTNETSNVTMEINKTDQLINETSNLTNTTVNINETSNLTNETNNVTIEINQTSNDLNETANPINTTMNETESSANETANLEDDTSNSTVNSDEAKN